jgi:hypothetical protein
LLCFADENGGIRRAYCDGRRLRAQQRDRQQADPRDTSNEGCVEGFPASANSYCDSISIAIIQHHETDDRKLAARVRRDNHPEVTMLVALPEDMRVLQQVLAEPEWTAEERIVRGDGS